MNTIATAEWTPSDNSHILGFPITWGDWGLVVCRPRNDVQWITVELARLRIPIETYIYRTEA